MKDWSEPEEIQEVHVGVTEVSFPMKIEMLCQIFHELSGVHAQHIWATEEMLKLHVDEDGTTAFHQLSLPGGSITLDRKLAGSVSLHIGPTLAIA